LTASNAPPQPATSIAAISAIDLPQRFLEALTVSNDELCVLMVMA
jgi:hypothetical protein